MAACCFGRTPLSPLLKVVLLHGSKLINLSNFCLSGWHYPDSDIYCCASGYPVTSGMWCTNHRHRKGFTFPATCCYYRPTPSLYLHQFLPHPLLNWSFQRTGPYSKCIVTTKLHGTNLVAKITVKIFYFSCSPSYSRSRTTPWTRQTFCLIQHSESHILCSQ